MVTIRLIDNTPERYTQEADNYCLGRMYDNIAEKVQVIKPKGEEYNVCSMIVKANGEVIDHIIVGNEPIDITSTLSQYSAVSIGFSFSNATGYIKNSGTRNYYFAYAEKPSDFVPMTPEQWTNVDLVMGSSLTKAVLEGNIIRYYNLANQVMSEVDLSLLLGLEQDATDNSLTTNNKTIVGAINEINAKLGNSAQTIQDILGV